MYEVAFRWRCCHRNCSRDGVCKLSDKDLWFLSIVMQEVNVIGGCSFLLIFFFFSCFLSCRPFTMHLFFMCNSLERVQGWCHCYLCSTLKSRVPKMSIRRKLMSYAPSLWLLRDKRRTHETQSLHQRGGGERSGWLQNREVCGWGGGLKCHQV